MVDNGFSLKIQNLSVRFESRKVLNDVSLCLKPGEKAAISGESGSGKSTILKCILGYIPFESGGVFIEGKEINVKNIWKLRHLLAYVPQEPDLGQGIVSDIIAIPFQYKANKHLAPDKNKILELFENFRLDGELFDKDVAKISGGEKQRVAIIISLLLKRRIYLLDEVTSALDDKSKAVVAKYFKNHQEISVVAVTHDPHFKSLCSKVYKLDKKGNLKE
jgi:ABC-type iron transport system FetAB ATPase subunit